MKSRFDQHEIHCLNLGCPLTLFLVITVEQMRSHWEKKSKDLNERYLRISSMPTFPEVSRVVKNEPVSRTVYHVWMLVCSVVQTVRKTVKKLWLSLKA